MIRFGTKEDEGELVSFLWVAAVRGETFFLFTYTDSDKKNTPSGPQPNNRLSVKVRPKSEKGRLFAQAAENEPLLNLPFWNNHERSPVLGLELGQNRSRLTDDLNQLGEALNRALIAFQVPLGHENIERKNVNYDLSIVNKLREELFCLLKFGQVIYQLEA